jgi:mRNA interferase MazF
VTRGKVVLVPFPFDDLSATKVRPAVCLTEEIGARRHVVLAFLTSRPRDETLPSDLALAPDDPDFALTGLRVPSTLRLHRLTTVAATFILRELGALSPRLLDQVGAKVTHLFCLTPGTADAPDANESAQGAAPSPTSPSPPATP